MFHAWKCLRTSWSSEQTDLVKGVPVLGRGVWTRYSLRFVAIQMMLLYKMDSVVKHINTKANVSDEVLIKCFVRPESQDCIYTHADVLFLINSDD